MKEEIGADLTQEWLENPFARYFGTDIQRWTEKRNCIGVTKVNHVSSRWSNILRLALLCSNLGPFELS
jgi:hypothetical protein